MASPHLPTAPKSDSLNSATPIAQLRRGEKPDQTGKKIIMLFFLDAKSRLLIIFCKGYARRELKNSCLPLLILINLYDEEEKTRTRRNETKRQGRYEKKRYETRQDKTRNKTKRDEKKRLTKSAETQSKFGANGCRPKTDQRSPESAGKSAGSQNRRRVGPGRLPEHRRS